MANYEPNNYVRTNRLHPNDVCDWGLSWSLYCPNCGHYLAGGPEYEDWEIDEEAPFEIEFSFVPNFCSHCGEKVEAPDTYTVTSLDEEIERADRQKREREQ